MSCVLFKCTERRWSSTRYWPLAASHPLRSFANRKRKEKRRFRGPGSPAAGVILGSSFFFFSRCRDWFHPISPAFVTKNGVVPVCLSLNQIPVPSVLLTNYAIKLRWLARIMWHLQTGAGTKSVRFLITSMHRRREETKAGSSLWAMSILFHVY